MGLDFADKWCERTFGHGVISCGLGVFWFGWVLLVWVFARAECALC